VILGASYDTPEANRAFKEAQGFGYSLLCDTEKTLGKAYGAANALAPWPNRITVVIDPAGKVQKVYPKVDAKTHFDEVLRDLGGTPPDAPPQKEGGFFKRLFGG
jgi:thioredoxin-dependent peroxiredoxin